MSTKEEERGGKEHDDEEGDEAQKIGGMAGGGEGEGKARKKPAEARWAAEKEEER